MKKIYKWIFLLIFPLPVFATHIVGGEFYLIDRQTSDYRFELGLNLYFDKINGQASAEDAQIIASVYRKSDNFLMGNVTLLKISSTPVTYNNPSCTVGSLSTLLLRYAVNINLSPSNFSDAGGYYVVWERCCRNNVIDNIQTPGSVGNAFYMEFPPVSVNGNRFINSSPQFPTVQGDYACINEPFFFPFGAKDADGDVLTYYLDTPLAGRAGNGTAPNPPPILDQNTAAPYPVIRWASGYSLNNIIQGSQPVSIDSKTGLITFTASKTGLYVFSVVCNEYRNGRQIGLVRRDFQIAVIDCPRNLSPVVAMKKEGKNIARNSTITVKANESRCFDLLLNDQFTSGTTNPSSLLKTRIIQTNFPSYYVSLTPTSGTVKSNTDTLRAKLCWANCSTNIPGQPFDLRVVVEDEGCPFPRTDTIRVLFDFEPRPSIASKISTDLPGNQATIIAGNQLSFNVLGTNADFDSVSVEAIGRGFTLPAALMTFTNILTTNDNIKIPFQWKPDCSLKTGNTYTVDFILKERRCGTVTPDTVTVKLRFEARPSQPPSIETTLSGNSANKIAGETVAFNVIATDPDNDILMVRAEGRGFSLKEVGIEYDTPKSGQGKLTIPFIWKIPCSSLGVVPDNKFIIDFITEDNSCQPDRFDTVKVTISVKDLEVQYDFLPVNMFTPNPEVDTLNSYFSIPDLPLDNCDDQFRKIEIYNRWGKVVYKTDDRNFKWAGTNFPSGGYYYLIYYEKRRWKGWINLIR
jgi:gliding motility-associated-like protein